MATTPMFSSTATPTQQSGINAPPTSNPYNTQSTLNTGPAPVNSQSTLNAGPAPVNSQVNLNSGPASTSSQVNLNSGFAPVQQVTDAWMSRLQPNMNQARDAEINRLKSQGITEGSEAWNNAMDTLNRSDTDARNQALLYGAQENNNIFNRGLAQNNQIFGRYNDIFNQGLAQNNQIFGRYNDIFNQGLAKNNQVYGRYNDIFNQGLAKNNQVFGQNNAAQQLALALRGQQSNEAYQNNQMNLANRQQWMNEQNNPYQQMMWLNSMNQGMPQFGGTGTGANYMGAGMQNYLSQLGNYNAKTANNQGMISGLAQLFGGSGGSGSGANTGGWGGMMSDLWKYFSGGQ